MEVFEEYRKKRAEKVCENYEEGSLYGYFYAQSMKESTEELINGLKKNFRHFLRGYNASH